MPSDNKRGSIGKRENVKQNFANFERKFVRQKINASELVVIIKSHTSNEYLQDNLHQSSSTSTCFPNFRSASEYTTFLLTDVPLATNLTAFKHN